MSAAWGSPSTFGRASLRRSRPASARPASKRMSAKLSATKRLELIRVAVYSVGDTLTAAEAIAFIAGFFSADPTWRINPGMLPAGLAALEHVVPGAARRVLKRRRQ